MSRERYALTAEDRDIAFSAGVQRALAHRVTNTSDRAQSQGDVALASLKRQLAIITTCRPNGATRAHALRLQIARLEAQAECVELEMSIELIKHPISDLQAEHDAVIIRHPEHVLRARSILRQLTWIPEQQLPKAR